MSSEEASRKEWHRIFGVMLTDLMTGTPFDVELEKDLSIQQQYLDVIVVRKRPGALAFRLPDGLEDLVDHNLITYKSMNEALDDWTLKELTGHYVNYRKQLEGDTLQPEEALRMFGVSTRYPQKLANELQSMGTQLVKKQQGVYEAQRGTDLIRIIVLREIPQEEHNAFWNMFSAVDKQVEYGTGQYKIKKPDLSTVIRQLFAQYKLEGLKMPFSVEEYLKESRARFLKEMTDAERQEFLHSMTDAERQEFLHSMTDAERREFLHSMTDAERQEFLHSMSDEQKDQFLRTLLRQKHIEGISLGEFLERLTAEEIKTIMDRRKETGRANGETASE